MRFLLRFLLAALVLFGAWKAGFWKLYARLVLWFAGGTTALLTGFDLERTASREAFSAVFVRGAERYRLPLDLEHTLAGVVAYAALVLATARGAGSRRVLFRGLLGLPFVLATQVLVVAFLPWMVTEHAWWVSRALDVVYVFTVLAGLGAFPFFLWMIWISPAGTEPAG
ncbi:MAG: hypothetical protein KatS3mg076_2449 [Candidatus Binatia bacterium]|nr:MAG: hypothetical protein KatS3mg076_2449 [Candidatus Binatia bacterium]